MPETYTTQAICLRAMDFSESDKILTLYSPDCGRISAIVKGARRPKSKLSGACEPLTLSEVQLARGKSLDVLCQYQPLEPFPALRGDILKLAFATLFAEEVRLMASEYDGNSEPIFTLFINALRHLEAATDAQVVPLAVSLQMALLDEAGYRPFVEGCVLCGEAIAPTERYYPFSAQMGGVLCFDCRAVHGAPGATVNVSTPTLKVLHDPADTASWEQADTVRVQKFFHYYFAQKFEKSLQAGPFLLQLLSG
jgi:DNA repair protein RecO (recombination protein O)